MKNNQELQTDVQNAIKWEPLLHAAEIGVIVNNGIVSLFGVVDSYAKKMEAENAAKRVNGVKAIIEKIEVKFPDRCAKTDTEVANEALTALRANYSIPQDKVRIKVEKGWITLEGQLPWNYQSEAAAYAVSYLTGVKGVTNNIKIKSEIQDEIEKQEVEKAIARSSSIDNNTVDVSVSGTTVTLTGIVNSWYQKEEAGRIAWKTSGIWDVKNELAIDHDAIF